MENSNHKTEDIRLIANHMTTAPISIDDGLPLRDARDRMAANNIRHLLVRNGGRLAGIVDFDDLILAREMAPEGAEDIPVRAAARGVTTCSTDAPVAVVAREMEASRATAAVVVNDRNAVVGIFTTTDALRALRSLAAGRLAEPVVQPHAGVKGGERELARHVRAGLLLAQHRAAPSPNDGVALGAAF